MNHAMASACWPKAGARRSPTWTRSGLSTTPMTEPVITKPSALARSGGGYMSVAATRSCCATFMPMPKSTGKRHHHQRHQAEGELHPGADERLRHGDERCIALDDLRNHGRRDSSSRKWDRRILAG